MSLLLSGMQIESVMGSLELPFGKFIIYGSTVTETSYELFNFYDYGYGLWFILWEKLIKIHLRFSRDVALHSLNKYEKWKNRGHSCLYASEIIIIAFCYMY